MATRAEINDFLGLHKLAVVGVSHTEKGFGYSAYTELKSKGYKLFPVNPNAQRFGDEPCYPSLRDLPEPVEGALIVVPPAETEKVVRDAAAAGIRHVWMQQGAGSKAAVQFCEDNGISVVHGQCILMHAQPAGFHRFHGTVWRLLGLAPK